MVEAQAHVSFVGVVAVLRETPPRGAARRSEAYVGACHVGDWCFGRVVRDKCGTAAQHIYHDRQTTIA